MKICILGGGSAGWMTALIAREFNPFSEIVLIESQKIGILGAGEGTVPHFSTMLESLRLPVSDLVKECKATMKIGINFENWNNDGKSYYHGFGCVSLLSEFQRNDSMIAYQLMNSMDVTELNFADKLSKAKKVPFALNEPGSPDQFNSFATYALHLDASLFAKYLRKVGLERNITVIDDIVVGVDSHETGDIKALKLESGISVDADFFFDCSGFARVLLGKHFKTPWKSYSDKLPVNTAIPFFIPHNDDVSPITEAISMKHGWLWRVPVQGRYGCGYVFDSAFVGVDEALDEVRKHFKDESIVNPTSFKFNAGTYASTLVKNCMGVSMAQSFIEPMEATAIWISCLNVSDFFINNGLHSFKSKAFAERLNARCAKRNEEVVDFLYLHYMTKRNDTEFWRGYQERHTPPEGVVQNLELLNNSISADLDTIQFGKISWVQVSCGLGLIRPDNLGYLVSRYGSEDVMRFKKYFIKNQYDTLEDCMTYKDFMSLLANS